MKNAFKLHDVQQKQKQKEEESWIHPPICCICNRKCEGYYSRHGETGTCSSKCMKVQDGKEKYPGHTAAEFEQRHSL